MGRRNAAIALGIVAAIAFMFLVPIIRFDTNVPPVCAREAIGCPLMIQTPITGHDVYWSITAYYIDIGTFLVTPSEIGDIA
jgi:hypothetical protein